MKLYDNPFDCCGCQACAAVCPRHAIEMKHDAQGFGYPVIDESLCVSCGLCEKVCQIHHPLEKKMAENCIGVKNQDAVRVVSSSGGVYTTISDVVLSESGVCVGCRFDDNMHVVHSVADNASSRDLFRGSKYVQSDVNGIYPQVYDELKTGKTVLFTGTPCQCAGLQQYLVTRKANLEHLILMDVVCHGVPSPLIWREYVSDLERRVGSKMTSYTFRNKEVGWRNYNIKAAFENGTSIVDGAHGRVFATLFSRDVMLRPSCYYCPYCSMERVSDLTIGDFWGIEHIDEAFSDNQGVSMLFINSAKGRKIWEKCQNAVSFKEYPLSCIVQPNLHYATSFNVEYDSFWETFNRHGYKAVATKYGGGGVVILAKVFDFIRRVKRKLR